MHYWKQREEIKTYDIVVYLQPTSPLCREEDIKSVKMLEKCTFNSAVAVTPVSTHPFKMKRLLQNGQLINYIDQGFEDMRAEKSCQTPTKGRIGYVSRRDVVMEEGSLVSEPVPGLKSQVKQQLILIIMLT